MSADEIRAPGRWAVIDGVERPIRVSGNGYVLVPGPDGEERHEVDDLDDLLSVKVDARWKDAEVVVAGVDAGQVRFLTWDRDVAEREGLVGDVRDGWGGVVPTAELTDVRTTVSSIRPQPLTPADRARWDRIEGVLLGAACGDALGVPYEFGSAPLAPGEAPRMIGGGLGPYAPGEWSDDTQMSVVIARVASGLGLRTAVALDAVVTGWVDWLAGGATDVGTQTRQVLGEVAADVDGVRGAERARLASYALHAHTGRTAGNGSLMRTAPVALAFLDEPAALGERARTISGLTHADPLAGDACVLWCYAIRQAVLDGAMADLADLVGHLPVDRRDQWAAWIAEAEGRPPAAFSPNGYVVTALQAAWSAIRHPLGDGGPVVASLTAAVHAGDDTDTVAAIAGSLLGAAHGASTLPAEWLADVHGWPGLRADDMRDLARRVATRGATDAAAHRQPRLTSTTLPLRDSSTVIRTRLFPGFFAQ